jgi:F0F1-type ATP synthase assembly protein I
MFLVKLALSNLIIVACVLIGRRFPALGGLIATMPLTSLIVLVWLASDNPMDQQLYREYTRGVVWGILPTLAFFAAAYLCLRRGIGLPAALGMAGVVWLGGALLHQWCLR